MNFKEIATRATKSGKCPVCGKKATVTEKFWQTVNPFNLDNQGIPKSASQIARENEKNAEIWKSEPAVHRKCDAIFKKSYQ